MKEAEHTLELTNGSLNIGRIAYKEGLQKTNVNVFLNYEPFASFENIGIANTLNNFILTLNDGYYYGVAANNMDYSSEIPGQTITYSIGNGNNIYNKLTFGVLSTSVSYQNKLNTINLYMFTYQDGFDVDFTRMVNGGALNLDNACKTFDVEFTYEGTDYAFTYDKWDQTHTLFMPHDTLIYVKPDIKPNYQFDTWKTSDALGDHANSIYTILEDGTLHEEVSGSTIEGVYAYSQNMAFKFSSGYTRAEIILRMVDGNTSPYTITYHSNNGQNQTKTEHFYTGAYIDGNSFEYAGHTFVNWNTQEDGNGQSYEEHAFYDTKSNLNLYAQWKNDAQSEKTYTLTYDANGGSGAPDSVQVAENTTYPLSTQGPTTPPEHTTTLLFEGWTLDNTKLDILTKDAAEDDIPQISNTINMDQPYTVYAVWAEDSNENGIADYKEVPITVKFELGEGTTNGETEYTLQPFGTTAQQRGQAPAVTAPEGQKFAQWQQHDGTHTLADQAYFTYDSIFAMTGGTASTVIFDAQYDNLPPAITDPTDDELNALIEVYVQCQTVASKHDWTFSLLDNSYSVTGQGKIRTVTIQATPYVTALSEKRGVEHENSGSDSATVDLVYDGSWKIDQGSSGKVTFQAKCKTYPVQLVIYRNGNTSDFYKTNRLADNMYEGEIFDLTTLEIDEFYKPDKFATGYEFEGWYNDDGWDKYIDGNPNNKLGDSITVNGWTNIICMVWDKFPVYYNLVNADGTVRVHTDYVTARGLASDKMYQHGDRDGYTFDGWYQTQKDFGNPSKQVGSLTKAKKWELYGTYVANSYDVIYDHNGKGFYNSQWETKTDADIPYDSTYTILGNMFAGEDLNGLVLDGWSLSPDGSVAFHPGDKVAFNNSTFPA